MVGRIKSIQIGRSQCFDSEGDSLKPWLSAIIKQCVSGTIFVEDNGLEGDEQADLIPSAFNNRFANGGEPCFPAKRFNVTIESPVIKTIDFGK